MKIPQSLFKEEKKKKQSLLGKDFFLFLFHLRKEENLFALNSRKSDHHRMSPEERVYFPEKKERSHQLWKRISKVKRDKRL